MPQIYNTDGVIKESEKTTRAAKNMSWRSFPKIEHFRTFDAPPRLAVRCFLPLTLAHLAIAAYSPILRLPLHLGAGMHEVPRSPAFVELPSALDGSLQLPPLIFH